MKLRIRTTFLVAACILTIVFGSPVESVSTDSPSNITASSNDLYVRAGGSVKCDTTSGSPRLHEIDFVINRIRKWAPVGLPCNRNLNKCRVVARNENHVVVSTCGVDWSGWSCWEIADRVQQIKDKCSWSMYSGGRWVVNKKQWIALHK